MLRRHRIGRREGGAVCFFPPRRYARHGQMRPRSDRKSRSGARSSGWRSLQVLILGRGSTNQCCRFVEERPVKLRPRESGGASWILLTSECPRYEPPPPPPRGIEARTGTCTQRV